MRFFVLLTAFFVFVSSMPSDLKENPYKTYSNSSELVAGCSYSATCTVSGVEGVCVSTSAGCCNAGTVTSNLCPGSSDIRCCTNAKCSTPSGSGTCMQTSLCSSKGGKSISGYCVGPSEVQCCVSGGSGGISRDEIIARAQDWVNRQIPYSQNAYTDGYRQDCSGYVSMAWKSSQPGHSTYDMQQICTKISKSEMKRGDAILNPNSHVLLFDQWVDSDNFYEYAEHDYGQVASHDVRSYSYYAQNGYFPCRYNNVA
jgi:hypothetical protein